MSIQDTEGKASPAQSTSERRHGTVSNTIMLVLAAGLVALAMSYPKHSARGGPYGQPDPMPTPPPTPPPVFTPPVIPPVVRPPIVVPTDVTNVNLVNPIMVPNIQISPALSGVQLLPDSQFPPMDNIQQDQSWITVLSVAGSVFTKPNGYTVDLQSGEIIVSVKSPSRIAFVITPFGTLALSANSDALVSFKDGVLRVMNFDGDGMALKAQLDKGPFAGPADPTVTLACGYELVAAREKITRTELRPKDGITRRFAKVLENGHLAVSEFSVESALKNCAMLVDLSQKVSGVKERRMLSDMSKMAAVLNYKHGTEGFSADK
ncbi:MAG: hypothetical protein IPK73_16750 [Candidatus Obscuribacter sp.]|nr:hypothetical protein [Candidatus Obscuribacter sp.]